MKRVGEYFTDTCKISGERRRPELSEWELLILEMFGREKTQDLVTDWIGKWDSVSQIDRKSASKIRIKAERNLGRELMTVYHGHAETVLQGKKSRLGSPVGMKTGSSQNHKWINFPGQVGRLLQVVRGDNDQEWNTNKGDWVMSTEKEQIIKFREKMVA